MTDDNYGCLPGPNNFRRIAEAMEQKPRAPGLNCPDRDWCAGNGCWWDCARPFDIDSEE